MDTNVHRNYFLERLLRGDLFERFLPELDRRRGVLRGFLRDVFRDPLLSFRDCLRVDLLRVDLLRVDLLRDELLLRVDFFRDERFLLPVMRLLGSAFFRLHLDAICAFVSSDASFGVLALIRLLGLQYGYCCFHLFNPPLFGLPQGTFLGNLQTSIHFSACHLLNPPDLGLGFFPLYLPPFLLYSLTSHWLALALGHTLNRCLALLFVRAYRDLFTGIGRDILLYGKKTNFTRNNPSKEKNHYGHSLRFVLH